ncbi:hypothetical protein Fmac_002482 [Flemingia macrophylla]|uniref:Scarecrow-like protein 15 n=1 Tax=Flemingia macrophylla TaxID=520843 RepID=A0ABD1NLE7_9FABA
MRVPVPSKPSNAALPNAGLCYEPTSVLDLCRSPSPSPCPATVPLFELEDHAALHTMDWDSIMKDLGLHDDSVFKTIHNNDFTPLDHALEFSDVYSNLAYDSENATLDQLVVTHDFNHNDFTDFIEDLIRAADCFDTRQLQVAHVILEHLNQRLRSPGGKPLQRAAFYFKEALLSLLSGSNRTPPGLSSPVHCIRAFKAFSGISPIPMFSIFTTNQIVLDHAASSFMHVIDFDIGLGIHYASLIKEIADKAPPAAEMPVLRITAVLPEEFSVESSLVSDNLNQFALELGIRVQIEFVPLRTFEAISFKAVKLVGCETSAVLLSPVIFRHLGNAAAAFLADLRRLSPGVVVFVDGEGSEEAATASAASFRCGVLSSLEYYTMMLESLDASTTAGEEGSG